MLDYVLFSNYERQVDALLAGHIDVAWNTNLAYVRAVRRTDGACRALAMRDTDLGFRTVVVARAGSGFRSLEDLRGRRLALGSGDSAQAAILPVHFLRDAGIGEADLTLLRHDTYVGKHGDTGRSELDAIYEQFGTRLVHLNQLLANLPPAEEAPAGAGMEEPAKVLSIHAFGELRDGKRAKAAIESLSPAVSRLNLVRELERRYVSDGPRLHEDDWVIQQEGALRFKAAA